jgi:biopolymer transport protein ExbD
MGGVDVGGGGKRRRSINADVNMVPFIDLLLVTVAFLLITAVWASSSRLEADAELPGQPGCGADCGSHLERTLHVSVGADDFVVAWRQAGTLLSEVRVPRTAVEGGQVAGAATRYPELAKRIEAEWNAQGLHRDPADRKVDQAVVHTDDRTPYREIVAVFDAIAATKRDVRLASGSTRRVQAFNLVFAQR